MTTVAASKKSLHPFDAGCRGWMRKPADTNEKQPNQRSQAASKGASPGRAGMYETPGISATYGLVDWHSVVGNSGLGRHFTGAARLAAQSQRSRYGHPGKNRNQDEPARDGDRNCGLRTPLPSDSTGREGTLRAPSERIRTRSPLL